MGPKKLKRVGARVGLRGRFVKPLVFADVGSNPTQLKFDCKSTGNAVAGSNPSQLIYFERTKRLIDSTTKE